MALKRDFYSWFIEANAMSIALDSYPINSTLGEWLGQFPVFNKWLTRTVYLSELILPLVILVPFKQKKIRL